MVSPKIIYIYNKIVEITVTKYTNIINSKILEKITEIKKQNVERQERVEQYKRVDIEIVHTED